MWDADLFRIFKSRFMVTNTNKKTLDYLPFYEEIILGISK